MRNRVSRSTINPTSTIIGGAYMHLLEGHEPLGPYAENSLVACVSHSGTSRYTSSMCWYAESSLLVVDLLVHYQFRSILLVRSRAVYNTH